eukprot:7865318-Pyramimonas_sp.AAC.1
MGSAGQPAESNVDSGTGADASSDDEAAALDYSDMPTYLAEEQRAQLLLNRFAHSAGPRGLVSAVCPRA